MPRCIVKGAPRHFVTRCPVCKKELEALTTIGLRELVKEHIVKHVMATPKKAPPPENGDLFGGAA